MYRFSQLGARRQERLFTCRKLKIENPGAPKNDLQGGPFVCKHAILQASRLGWTALHLSASYGHVAVTQFLAERWPELVHARHGKGGDGELAQGQQGAGNDNVFFCNGVRFPRDT